MKRLTKKQVQEQADLAEDLRETADSMGSSVLAYNVGVQEAFDTYAAVLEAVYHEHIEPLELESRMDDAESFRDDIACRLREYFDGRSEKWQDSDAGEQYVEWVEAWEECGLDLYVEFAPPEPDPPEPLEAPVLDWQAFEDLGDSP